MDELAVGIRVAVAGAVIVFGLLLLLWGLLEVGLRLELRAATPSPERQAVPGVTVQPTDGRPPDAETVAAIAVAVTRHAELRRREAAPAMRLHWPGSLLFASRWVGAGRTRQSQSWRRR